MATIKGQNLRVLVGGKCIAMATSCTFHVAAQMEDSSTKDDTGNWQSQEVTGLSWDASTDSLVTLTDNGSNGELPQDIFTAMIAMTPVTLTFDTTAGTNNRVAQNGALKKSGQAYISDISITAANRANSTMTVQFQGNGALS
jgi:hypothetical protein